MMAAERLYGQHGLDGISLRQLVAAAGQANNYAVQHHFGSKLGLIQAVSEMRLPAMEAERGVLLALARRDGDLGLERMLGALFAPLVTVLDDASLQDYARFTLSVMHLEPHLHPFMKSADISPASMEIHGRLEQCLSHLPPDVFRRRLSLAASVFLNGASQMGGKLVLSADGYATRESFFRDIFRASLGVLSAPFPPEAYGIAWSPRDATPPPARAARLGGRKQASR
ncbi:MAG: TetR/AcrR family transcriptional regulator [Phenylobacterium sp.]|nr:TetR/AcrR family transcriptional regulator [Phenylobacterium sp.]